MIFGKFDERAQAATAVERPVQPVAQTVERADRPPRREQAVGEG
jgi:hypothetical protein